MRQRDQENEQGGLDRLVTGLGWFSVGLGTAQLLAPKQVARLAGLSTKGPACMTMRLFGARELMSGLGILRRRAPSRWLMARVAGDLLDLSALGSSFFSKEKRFRRRASTRGRLTTALASVAAVTALDVLGYRGTTKKERRLESPREAAELKAAITIDRSAQDLYAFWREVENLPRFMTHVASVEGIDERRSRWTMKVPGTPSASWEATIVEDRPGELIGWRTEGSLASQIMEGGEVSFQPAPGGRGTEVHVVLRTAGATLPSALARWLKKVPQRWLAHELRLFKQLMELGEIPKAESRFKDSSHTISAGRPGHEIPRPFIQPAQGATS